MSIAHVDLPQEPADFLPEDRCHELARMPRRILRLPDGLAAITPPSRRTALEARRRQIHDAVGQLPADSAA